MLSFLTFYEKSYAFLLLLLFIATLNEDGLLGAPAEIHFKNREPVDEVCRFLEVNRLCFLEVGCELGS